MLDTSVSTWLILAHQLPPEPAYLRVKLRRRLVKLGALPLKNTVYVLPNRGDALEDFQWLAAEIRSDGGEAIVCEGRFLDGMTDDDMVAQFEQHVSERYADVAANAQETIKQRRSDSPSENRGALQREHARLAKQLDDIARVDFFGAASGEGAREAVKKLADAARPSAPRESVAAEASSHEMRARVWVTRADVFVDRMASAWLIRRFVDADARFKFVTGTRYVALPGEIRFDMPRGEYTHKGDACTFEVLCAQFTPDDVALRAIGEIVHDIDLKDDKFGRPEVDGVSAVLRGIRETVGDDDARLTLAARVFDGLYAQFQAGM
jgi:hypothetical protein